MNKRQYIFIFLLSILLYISYTILKYEYKKYTINEYKQEQREIISDIKLFLEEATQIIAHKKSPAYKNKLLKEQQGFQMRGETVTYLTHEKTFKKFQSPDHRHSNVIYDDFEEKSITQTMTNFQKWIYFLLKKDTR